MSKTIDEAKDFSIDSSDRKILEGLRDDKEWKILKKVVESYILRLTANLVTGTELYDGSRAKELDKLSGFVYYWRKITNLIEPQKDEE